MSVFAVDTDVVIEPYDFSTGDACDINVLADTDATTPRLVDDSLLSAALQSAVSKPSTVDGVVTNSHLECSPTGDF